MTIYEQTLNALEEQFEIASQALVKQFETATKAILAAQESAQKSAQAEPVKKMKKVIVKVSEKPMVKVSGPIPFTAPPIPPGVAAVAWTPPPPIAWTWPAMPPKGTPALPFSPSPVSPAVAARVEAEKPAQTLPGAVPFVPDHLPRGIRGTTPTRPGARLASEREAEVREMGVKDALKVADALPGLAMLRKELKDQPAQLARMIVIREIQGGDLIDDLGATYALKSAG